MSGCHLITDAKTWWHGRPSEPPLVPDYGPNMADMAPDLPNPHGYIRNEAGRTIYKGYWLDDAPATPGEIPGGLTPGDKRGGTYFEAHAYVQEAPSVQTYYGFFVAIDARGTEIKYGGRTYIDSESHHPRDPWDPTVAGKDAWQGPAPLDVRAEPYPEPGGLRAIRDAWYVP